MNTANFSIGAQNQTVSINTELISGSHDELFAYLSLPVSFTLQSAENTGFHLLPLNAQLLFQNPTQLLSETISTSGTTVGRTGNPSFVLQFKLDPRVMHFIEKKRVGDIKILLTLNVHTLFYRVSGSQGHIQSDEAKINFTLPRSVWIEKLLPALGFRNLKLIEIPLTHDILKEAYAHIISEFNKAEQYFNDKDYNKCVAHCRNTMDELKRELKLIKDNVESKSNFDWLKSINDHTRDWIDKVNRSTQAIASKAHHAGQTSSFTRHEAESIYVVVLGLMNYIGHLQSRM